MHLAVCICSLVPRIETKTHLVLILHQLEVSKTTNTGRLATRCLPNSRIVIRGQGEPVPNETLWPATHQPILLFPCEGAQPLERVMARQPVDAKPFALIVPDGTWTQASRARRRIPCLTQIPAVTITSDGPSMYKLRTANEPGQVCTMEAIALAMEQLEGSNGANVRNQLQRILHTMVDRTMWTRGRLTAAEVTGGIPAGARTDQPWAVPAGQDANDDAIEE